MKRLCIPFFLLILFTACSTPPSDFTLNPLFQDNLVMQHNQDFIIWGTANPGAEISIESSWGESAMATASESGQWQAALSPAEPGGPYTISINASDKQVRLQNVMSGEVWLASGQSNMEMPLRGWPPRDTIDYAEREISQANYPDIRMITVQRAISETPLDNFTGEWKVTTPENASDFSATAYFFARKLYEELQVPIGIIHTSWGGTPAESWVSEAGLRELGDFNESLDELKNSTGKREASEAWMNSLTKSPRDNENPTQDPLEDDELSASEWDDSGWNTMSLPTLWEDEIGRFDGMVWFRKTIDLANVPAGEVELHLGAIDDLDVTYVNGTEVGKTIEPGNYQKPRVYTIPEGVLKEGTNVIAVNVYDGGGGGGIYNGEMRLGDIPLEGEWKFLPTGEYRNGELLHLGTDGKAYSERVVLDLDQYTPSALYNAMIHPVIDYAFKGAIWYQGESNVGRAEQYERLFPAMITNWRELAGEMFPFYFVQIAPFVYGGPENGDETLSAELRDAQRKTLSLPNTGMVVTMDIGNVENIHPGNKQDVGLRLALNALGTAYANQEVSYSGPLPVSAASEGNGLIISFEHADGLRIEESDAFEVAGSDMVFHPASAEVRGNQLYLASDKVSEPVHARYAFHNVTLAYLFNESGLPASSFEVSIDEN